MHRTTVINDEDIVTRRDEHSRVSRRRKVAQRSRRKNGWGSARMCVPQNDCLSRPHVRTTGSYVNTLDRVNLDMVAVAMALRPFAIAIADAPQIVSPLSLTPPPIRKFLSGAP